MKKLISIIIFTFSSLLIQAQPIPDCAKNSAYKKIFLEGDKELICDLKQFNSIPNNINSCFTISQYKIKDSLNITYFSFNIYKSINDFSENRNKMEIYFINVLGKKSFSLYLEIAKFKEGIYFIDVSKKGKIKKVSCQMCRDTIEAIDVTPKKWCTRKRWRN